MTGGTSRFFAAVAALASLLAGCGDFDNADTLTLLPGVYAGSLPCSNCPQIVATLWLRADGRFFFRQTFAGENDSPDTQAYALGRWHWDEQAAEAVLHGAGPQRHIRVLDAQNLRLRTTSPVEHLLTRDLSAPPFTDRIPLDGESTVADNGAVFTECLTGLRFAVADTGAFRELQRQHRLLNSGGKAAFTSIEGHIVAVADGETTSETLVVDRFITLRPGTSC